jgi:hypothetical protein
VIAVLAALLFLNLVDGTWASFPQVMSGARGIDEYSMAWR